MVILSDSVTGMCFPFFTPKSFSGEVGTWPYKALHNHIKYDFLTFSLKKIFKLEQQNVIP